MLRIGIYEKKDKYFNQIADYIERIDNFFPIVYTVNSIASKRKGINHFNVNELIEKSFGFDKGDIFLRAKNFFVENVDVAIVEITAGEFIGHSYSASFINKMSKNNSKNRLLVISDSPQKLEYLFQNMALGKEKNYFEKKLSEKDIIFSKILDTNFLNDSFEITH